MLCAYYVSSTAKDTAVRGRGAGSNPPNRFERLAYVPEPDSQEEESPSPRTQFLRDTSQSIIAYNDSPDVGFDASINPYRGCEHGCIYCYARPTHEYLGFSAGLDFETRILVKEDAPALLKKELSAPRWKPQVLGVCGVTDAYQPVESRLRLTRRCLEVLLEFRNPVAVITKNHLVTRDSDLLAGLAEFKAARVLVSVTTLDANLARVMEPRTSTPERRLAAIQALAEAGVPVGVLVAPVVPGLTDHEIPSIINAAAAAGATSAGYVVVRLPYAVKDLFQEWLSEHFPDRKKKILSHITDLRSGKLNDPEFNSRMRGQGVYADQIRSMFMLARRRAGIPSAGPELSTASFRRPAGDQPSLFEF
ncbi:MAG TPA: PA0069 family radical SAM protein [Blastocatellia bacterium]|nr:PA0069 family radical SAM protein [Blastocatellia bacterium]